MTSLILPAQPAAAAEQISCRESASIYAATGDGTLLEYFHNTPESGSYDWKPQRSIGQAWSQMTVVTGADGRIYQIPNNGELRRFRHTGTEWERPGGGWYTTIDTGWGQYRDAAQQNRVAVDSNGDFYTIDSTGTLTWSRYNEHAGTWTKRPLTSQWGRFDHIVAAGNGVFYVRDKLRNNGSLYRFQYHADSQSWLQAMKIVGDAGWNMHRRIFSPGGDVLYAVEPNGTLWWYRWSESASTFATPTSIGTGWSSDWQIGAMTDACTLSGLPTRLRPAPRPVQDLARSELIETQNGLIQGYYVDSYGTLKVATQAAGSAVDFLGIEPIETPGAVSTTPTAVMYKGRPNVFALGTSTDIYEGSRSDNGVSWPALNQFGGWTVDRAEAITYPDGRRRLYAVDGIGRLLTRGQSVVDAPMSPWAPIAFNSLTGEIIAMAANNTDVELLAYDVQGNLASLLHRNGTADRMRSITDAAGRITGRPAAVIKDDGKVQVFARRADGKIHTIRDTGSGFGNTWTPLDGVTANGAPAAVISEGKIKVAVRSTDGFVYTNGQSEVDGPFTGWTKLVDSRTGNAWPTDTEPSMVALSTGKVVVMYRSADEVTFTFESAPASTGVAARSASTSSGTGFVGGPSPKPQR
ncbi:tachylectin-related carbohydrate-binding protein [Lentzea albidocapillata]|uniref:tachylectin-related carbohydrate-binding protein n=1 Tax=Lentzea albidocapillata TaxID=40571 RepID=UPI001FECD86E|nr:tachylectin-related carbohydrate-binding protein [Lentzea albidocapillata]